MLDPNSQVVYTMRKYLPDVFLADLTRTVLKVYREAHEDSTLNMHPKLIKFTRPQIRVRRLDTEFEKIARRHFTLEGTIKSNETGSNAYAELTVQERIILHTSSVSKTKKLLPRPSSYRLKNSLKNPSFKQLPVTFQQSSADNKDSSTEKESQNNVIKADFKTQSFERKNILELPELYVLVVHGPTNEEEPKFIKLIAPDADYRFSIGTIDLLSEYSNYEIPEKEDLTPTEIPKPSAKLRLVQEKYIEEDEEAAGEGESPDKGGKDETT
ncbi:MAG: hypothetical protein AAF572_21950 [Cyanobacteria bacterium P01_B01_bin.77]